MERLGKKFSSFEEADLAEDQYYKSLSPNERVDLLLDLVARHQAAFDGTPERFERVFRLAPIEES